MVSSLKGQVPLAFLLLAWIVSTTGAALLADEAVELMATRLDQNQEKQGPHAGLWKPEVLFMGPTTGGMVCAYEWTGNADYLASAELAGQYLLWFTVAQGNALGDEIYAFMRLSEVSDDPNDNVWRSALVDWFYSMRKPGYEESTAQYISYFEESDPATAVFYIAHHTVSAYYVDDQDKKMWRNALVRYLSHVDDEANFPVMALGVATWALATTGPLDDTPVTSLMSAAYWDGVVLRDLPGLLAGHQVPEGEPFAGSFYWRFDHTSGGTGGVVAGYTEDCIFGAQGLVAAASLETEATDTDTENDAPEQGLNSAIEAARAALLAGIDEEGRVFEHLSGAGRMYYTYAGEMLQILWSMEQCSAFETDGDVESEVDVAVQ